MILQMKMMTYMDQIHMVYRKHLLKTIPVTIKMKMIILKGGHGIVFLVKRILNLKLDPF